MLVQHWLRQTAVVWASLLVAISQAQTASQATPGQEGLQQRQQQELQMQRERLQRQSNPELAPPTLAASPELSDVPCFTVRQVRVRGTTLLDAVKLHALTESYEENCMGLLSIDRLLRAVNQLYIDAGYVSARTYVEQQDLSTGTLELSVTEGVLEGIDWHGDVVSRGKVLSAFGNLVGRPLNLRDIEQGIDQLSRLQSLDVMSKIQPGSQEGYSRLDLTVNQVSQPKINLSLDNSGLESTGTYKYGVGFTLEDVLGLADVYTLNYARSSNNALSLSNSERPGGSSLALGASIPHAYWLFSADTYLSDYQGSLQTTLGTRLKTSGNTANTRISAERVVFRDQTQKLRLQASVSRAEMQNYLALLAASPTLLELQSRVTSAAQVGMSFSKNSDASVVTLALDVKQGIDLFGATAQDDPKLAGRNAHAQKITLDASFSHAMHLGSYPLRYAGSISLQLSNDNLLGEEQISIGGASSVRGVSSGVFSGNSGAYWRNELSMPIQPWTDPHLHDMLGTLEPYAALDYGHINGQSDRGIVEGYLVGGALGLRSRGHWGTLDLGCESILDVQPTPADFSKSTHWYFKLQLQF